MLCFVCDKNKHEENIYFRGIEIPICVVCKNRIENDVNFRISKFKKLKKELCM